MGRSRRGGRPHISSTKTSPPPLSQCLLGETSRFVVGSHSSPKSFWRASHYYRFSDSASREHQQALDLRLCELFSVLIFFMEVGILKILQSILGLTAGVPCSRQLNTSNRRRGCVLTGGSLLFTQCSMTNQPQRNSFCRYEGEFQNNEIHGHGSCAG